jgi:hypothetical protein
MTFDGVFCRITDDTCRDIVFPRWLSTASQSGWGSYIGQENAQTVVFVGNDRSVHALINFEIIKDKAPGKYTCRVKKLAFDPTFIHKTHSDDDDHIIGSPLLRWAFTYARHCCCNKITAFCRETDIASYKRLDFKEENISPHPQEYVTLEKKILYNVPFRSDPING